MSGVMPPLPFSLSTSCGRTTGLGEPEQALYVWDARMPGCTCGAQRAAMAFIPSFHGVPLSTSGLVASTFTHVDIL